MNREENGSCDNGNMEDIYEPNEAFENQYDYDDIGPTLEETLEAFPYLRGVTVIKLSTAPDGTETRTVIHQAEPPAKIEEKVPELPPPFLGTVYSEDRKYRYIFEQVLKRFGPAIVFIGLNPSSSDENNDSFIRRCISFSERWGVGHMVIVNLFALIAPNAKVLFSDPDRVGPDNNQWIIDAICGADQVIACWGVNGKYLGRDEKVCSIISRVLPNRMEKKIRIKDYLGYEKNTKNPRSKYRPSIPKRNSN